MLIAWRSGFEDASVKSIATRTDFKSNSTDGGRVGISLLESIAAGGAFLVGNAVVTSTFPSRRAALIFRPRNSRQFLTYGTLVGCRQMDVRYRGIRPPEISVLLKGV